MRSLLPKLACQCHPSEESEWKMENVRGLHRPNKACPKDSFPLPRINQIVDSTAGHKLLMFIDALSGYNQIKTDKED